MGLILLVARIAALLWRGGGTARLVWITVLLHLDGLADLSDARPGHGIRRFFAVLAILTRAFGVVSIV